MGYQIKPKDEVKYGKKYFKNNKLVYLLFNKPKNCITTANDPEGRKTVMDYVRDECPERIYPVGRLDRNTTGLLLLTNDGDLTKKLTHPSFGAKKLYHVTLDKPLEDIHFEKIKKGLVLEDGKIIVDKIEYITDAPNNDEVGVDLHSGKNRVVRRIFEHLGYTVQKLDRVVFAGLNKKNLPRGYSRFLSKVEIAALKMIPK